MSNIGHHAIDDQQLRIKIAIVFNEGLATKLHFCRQQSRFLLM